MASYPKTNISKSDFLLYLEAPRHLWAEKHGRIKHDLSDFDRHLIDEGYAVENLAREYFDSVFLPQNPNLHLFWQKAESDGPFTARLDALVHNLDTDKYDLYEVKSATNPDKKDLYDLAYQACILKGQIPVDNYYLFHLNKEYVHNGIVDLAQLFVADNLNDKVMALLPEIETARKMAFMAAQALNPNDLDYCLNPRQCPCPEICHPDLPEFSIYDIPRLHQKKKQQLAGMGILAARDIPMDFDLNDKQRLVAETARSNTEFLDHRAMKAELDTLQFPLWFLDYETCISAIPRYAGYHPQQQIAFQYSLHRMDTQGGPCYHTGHIAICQGDPTLSLLEHLSNDLGRSGTVIVWNKSFEMTINKNMADLHPEFTPFIEDLNSRIYDLGEIVNKGIYLHPGFKGSWSIKNVLPVMVPELSYFGLDIHKGDQASMAWWRIIFDGCDEDEKILLEEALWNYCELDTLAMVEIFNRFWQLENSS